MSHQKAGKPIASAINPERAPEEAAQVVDMLDRLPRRDALRVQVQTAASGRLDGTDTAVLVGIGLLAALPSTIPHEIPPALQSALGGVVLVRSQLLDRLGGSGSLPVESVIQQLGQHSSGGIWVASLFGSAQQAGLLPDMEDGFETLATGKLTDWWCGKRSWKPDSQSYHEAKALAYAVNAVFGAYFNPDPLAFSLAAWHGWRALRTSQKLTRQLVELTDLAIADGRAVRESYDAEVALSERSLVQTPGQCPFGEVDDVELMLPSAPRRFS